MLKEKYALPDEYRVGDCLKSEEEVFFKSMNKRQRKTSLKETLLSVRKLSKVTDKSSKSQLVVKAAKKKEVIVPEYSSLSSLSSVSQDIIEVD